MSRLGGSQQQNCTPEPIPNCSTCLAGIAGMDLGSHIGNQSVDWEGGKKYVYLHVPCQYGCMTGEWDRVASVAMPLLSAHAFYLHISTGATRKLFPDFSQNPQFSPSYAALSNLQA